MINNICDHIREHGLYSGLKLSGTRGIELSLMTAGKRWNFGQKPFTEDWDVLILLDACRYDLFQEFASDHSIYNSFSSIESRYSCASTSIEWIRKVYRDGPRDVLSDTHLVSANGWEPKELNLEIFGTVSPVWEYESENKPTIPPDVVTDAAINAGRTTDCSRMIVHYMQPHAPFLHVPGKYDSINERPGDGKSQNVWEGLREGKFDQDEVWNDYGQNLLTGLDEVERLVSNVSGKCIISADHANALGEWGVYGHPKYVIHPTVKKVPWVRFEATDKQTSDPEQPVEKGVTDVDVESHLRDLGYVV